MTQIKRPQALDDLTYTGEDGDTWTIGCVESGEDVLDQPETISIEELGEIIGNDQMTTAGVDDLTPVDTFLEMQGDTTYVTEI